MESSYSGSSNVCVCMHVMMCMRSWVFLEGKTQLSRLGLYSWVLQHRVLGTPLAWETCPRRSLFCTSVMLILVSDFRGTKNACGNVVFSGRDAVPQLVFFWNSQAANAGAAAVSIVGNGVFFHPCFRDSLLFQGCGSRSFVPPQDAPFSSLEVSCWKRVGLPLR